MNLEMLGNLGEFVSGIVVIASLAYLAVQVRHNTRSLRTENYARALERISAIQSRLSQDGDFNERFSKGLLDLSQLSRNERVQFTWCLYELLGAQEFLFHQSQAGAIQEEVWERWSETMAWWLAFPGVRSWWHARPTPFSASFTAYIDALLERPQVDSNANQRWRDFVQGAEATPPHDQAEL